MAASRVDYKMLEKKVLVLSTVIVITTVVVTLLAVYDTPGSTRTSITSNVSAPPNHSQTTATVSGNTMAEGNVTLHLNYNSSNVPCPIGYAELDSGGNGQSYISEKQMLNLTGSTGAYNGCGETNSSSLEILLSQSGDINLTVNSIFEVTYMATTSNSSNVKISEVVFQIPNATKELEVYDFDSNKLRNEAVANITMLINQSMDGMTYSYVVPAAKQQQNLTMLIGIKGDEVATVEEFGKSINISTLASIVSMDMP